MCSIVSLLSVQTELREGEMHSNNTIVYKKDMIYSMALHYIIYNMERIIARKYYNIIFFRFLKQLKAVSR